MSRTVRFYKSKRCEDDFDWHQTEIDLTTKDCTEDCEPVTYRALRKLHLVIPARQTFTIRPGNLYARRSPKGTVTEFEVMPCRHSDHHEQRRRSSHRALTLSQQEARLLERQQCLENELAAREEREVQERIGVRDRRPYASGGLGTGDHPALTDDDLPRASNRRKVSFIDREPQESRKVRYECYDDHRYHPRRHSQAYAEYRYRDSMPPTSRQEHCVQDIYPPTSYLSYGRRPSHSHRVARSYKYHEGIPLLFQRIITGGKSKKSHDCGCRRYPAQYYDADVRFDDRAPEDYR